MITHGAALPTVHGIEQSTTACMGVHVPSEDEVANSEGARNLHQIFNETCRGDQLQQQVPYDRHAHPPAGVQLQYICQLSAALHGHAEIW